MPRINATSYSRLLIFEQCPYRASLAFLEKIPEPDRPDDGRESPLDRGIRIHGYAEDFVTGKTKDLATELSSFETEYKKLRELYKKGTVEVEQMWCYTDTWQNTVWNDWSNVWLRIKLDSLVFLSDKEAVCIDTKTGKRFGNEVKNAGQMQLYQLGAFHKYPALELVHTELWYVDLDEMASMSFNRKQGMRYLKSFNDRFRRMTTAEEFPATPSMDACRYCPYKTGSIGKYGPEGRGICSKNPI